MSTDSPQTSQRTWSFDFLCFEINLWRQFLGHVMRDGEELGDAASLHVISFTQGKVILFYIHLRKAEHAKFVAS